MPDPFRSSLGCASLRAARPLANPVRSSLGCASLRAARPLANPVFALAVAVAMALAAASADAQTGGHVLRVVGSVEIATGEPPSWRPAHAGEALPPGAAIRTGDGARAEVALDSGTVRVYENSLLRIPARRASGADRLWLGLGAAIFDVELARGNRFEVETPEAVAAVKGTRFHVSVESGRASFGVYEGVVELRGAGSDPAEEPLLVREGFGARSEHDTFELVVLERMDAWDAWEAGAPPPDPATGAAPAALEPELEERSDAAPAKAEAADESGSDADRDLVGVEADLLEDGDDPFDAGDDSFVGDEPYEGPARDDLFERDETTADGSAFGRDK